jgi:hypothetical protein
VSYVVLSTLIIYLASAGLISPDYASAGKSTAPTKNATAPSNMTATAPSTDATIKAKLAQLGTVLEQVQSLNAVKTSIQTGANNELTRLSVPY